MKGQRTLVKGAKLVFWAFIIGLAIRMAEYWGIMHGEYFPILGLADWIIAIAGLVGVLMLGYVLYIKNR